MEIENLSAFLAECPMDDYSPLVSVIMPVFNTPSDPLHRAVNSVLAQSHENLELIIVDDGSEDDCLEALRGIAAPDPRIRLIQTAHAGVSAARNEAIEVARGDWIAFMDADDELEPSFLKDSLLLADACKADFVIGSVQQLYQGQEKSPKFNFNRGCVIKDNVSLSQATRQMLSPMKSSDFCGPNFRGRGPVAKLYKKSLMDCLYFNEGISNGEDVLFNYEYMKRCSAVVIAEKVWYWYYQNQGSAVHSTNIENWLTSLNGLMEACRRDSEYPEFYTRCQFLACEAVASLVRSSSFYEIKGPAIRLLRRSADLGCLGPELGQGFDCPLVFRIMAFLCRRGWYGFAFYYWAVKTLVSDKVKHRDRLFDLGRGTDER